MTKDWENGNIFWENHVRILAGYKLRSVCGFPWPFQGDRGMYIQRQAMELVTLNLWVLLPEKAHSVHCNLLRSARNLANKSREFSRTVSLVGGEYNFRLSQGTGSWSIELKYGVPECWTFIETPSWFYNT